MKKIIRHKKNSLSFDIAPLLDVMFMLLLFFMLTSSFLTPAIPLTLPEASNNNVTKEQDIIVSIAGDGSLYINRTNFSDNEFKEQLRQHVSRSQHKKVIFKGDESVIYKRFIEVLDWIKTSGASEVSIAHEQK